MMSPAVKFVVEATVITLVPLDTVPETASDSDAATFVVNVARGNQKPSPDDLAEASTRKLAPVVSAVVALLPNWMNTVAANLVDTSCADEITTLFDETDCSERRDVP